MTCAYCGGEAQGNFSIHRDGFGVGPEVDLCDDCGGGQTPSCAAIWDRIALPSTDSFAFKPASVYGPAPKPHRSKIPFVTTKPRAIKSIPD